jgi:hypothetical protein
MSTLLSDPKTFAYALAMAIIMVASAVGVLNQLYEDTLWQRVGMTFCFLGSLGALWAVLNVRDVENSNLTVVVGVAIYGFATALKQRKLIVHGLRHGLF